jgi:hypothetical protein
MTHIGVPFLTTCRADLLQQLPGKVRCLAAHRSANQERLTAPLVLQCVDKRNTKTDTASPA